MPYDLDQFLEGLYHIEKLDPKYSNGGTGKNGKCDCIGLVMGSMYGLGHKQYALHSTNYFARYQMVDLLELYSASDLFVGQLVYKRGNDPINARYLQGGRYYTGDNRDYYHVGVVMSKSPVLIMHCTKYGSVDGITFDHKLGTWCCGGHLKDLDYTAGVKEVISVAAIYDAKVVTSGGILNIRARPSISGTDLGDIPNGALLQVQEETNDSWAKVFWEGIEGYVKREFISRIEDNSVTSGNYAVIFRFQSREEAQAFIDTLKANPELVEQ